MRDKLEEEISRDVKEEKKEIEYIEEHIGSIKNRLLDRVPDHFSRRDVMNAFFGALTIGLTFILKGGTVKTAVGLDLPHTELIIAATMFVLFAEIYFIGYSRVRNKSQRRFGQFMTKRLLCLYGITLVISISLVYLFNLNNSELIGSFSDVLKVVFLVAFPCAIGAAIPSLLKQF